MEGRIGYLNCRIGQNNVCLLNGCAFKRVGDQECISYKPDFITDIENKSKEQKLYNITNVPKKPKKVLPSIAKTSSEKNLARRMKIWNRSSGICYLCGEPVSFVEFTIEHLFPLSKGGGNDLNNLRASHEKCNQKKGDSIFPGSKPKQIKKQYDAQQLHSVFTKKGTVNEFRYYHSDITEVNEWKYLGKAELKFPIKYPIKVNGLTLHPNFINKVI